MNEQNQVVVTPSTCSICLEPLVEHISVVKCGHCYHHVCIFNWIEQKPSCPLCSKRVHRSHIRPLFLQFLKVSHTVSNDKKGDDINLPNQQISGTMQQQRIAARNLKEKYDATVSKLEARLLTMVNELEQAKSEILSHTSSSIRDKKRIESHASECRKLRSELLRVTSESSAKSDDNEAMIAELQAKLTQLQHRLSIHEFLKQDDMNTSNKNDDLVAKMRRKVSSMGTQQAFEFLIQTAGYSMQRTRDGNRQTNQDLSMYRDQSQRQQRENLVLKARCLKLDKKNSTYLSVIEELRIRLNNENTVITTTPNDDGEKNSVNDGSRLSQPIIIGEEPNVEQRINDDTKRILNNSKKNVERNRVEIMKRNTKRSEDSAVRRQSASVADDSMSSRNKRIAVENTVKSVVQQSELGLQTIRRPSIFNSVSNTPRNARQSLFRVGSNGTGRIVQSIKRREPLNKFDLDYQRSGLFCSRVCHSKMSASDVNTQHTKQPSTTRSIAEYFSKKKT